MQLNINRQQIATVSEFLNHIYELIIDKTSEIQNTKVLKIPWAACTSSGSWTKETADGTKARTAEAVQRLSQLSEAP